MVVCEEEKEGHENLPLLFVGQECFFGWRNMKEPRKVIISNQREFTGKSLCYQATSIPIITQYQARWQAWMT